MCYFIEADEEDPSVLRISQDVIDGRQGTFYIGFAPLRPDVEPPVDVSEDILEPNATFSYSIRSSTAGCYYMVGGTGAMSSSGCTVSHQ